MRQWLLAAAITVVALWTLAHLADFESIATAWARFDIFWFALAAVFYLINIAARAWRLRVLTAGSGSGPYLAWLRLAALHQVVFTLLPSGTGDLGYPILALRTVGTAPAPALRVLFLYRFQDLMALLVMAGGGLLLIGDELRTAPAVLAIALAAFGGLFAAADLARLFARLFSRVLEAMNSGGRIAARWRSAALDYVRAFDASLSLAVRCAAALACLIAWCAAAASLWTLFAMAEIRLDLAEIMLVIVGLNLVGALATFTIAGLGVSEGGLAIVLAALGYPVSAAAGIALAVRPLALINSLVVCGAVEMFFRLARLRRSATKPTGGTTPGRER